MGMGFELICTLHTIAVHVHRSVFLHAAPEPGYQIPNGQTRSCHWGGFAEVLLSDSELSETGLSRAERGLDGGEGKFAICLVILSVARLVLKLTASLLDSF